MSRTLKLSLAALAVILTGLAFFLLKPITVSAETVTLDISQGSITITSTGYSVDSNTETPYSGEYVITGTADNHKITIRGDHVILLDNVNINNNDYGYGIMITSGTVDFSFKGVCTVTAGGGGGDFVPIGVQETATLILSGADGNDSILNAIGTSDGKAAIGGAWDQYKCGTIIINSGTINATGGGHGAAVIGGGGNISSSGSVTINGGVINCTLLNNNSNGSRQAAEIGGDGMETEYNGGIVNGENYSPNTHPEDGSESSSEPETSETEPTVTEPAETEPTGTETTPSESESSETESETEAETTVTSGSSPSGLPSGGGSAAGITVTSSEQLLLAEIANAAEGDTITFEIKSGSTALSKAVFDAMVGRDITLIIKLRNGVYWTINGKDIERSQKVDFGVTLNTNFASDDEITELAGDRKTVSISIKHNGDLGFTGLLHIPVSKSYNGQYANLYYYSNDGFEFVRSSEISDGYAEFVFSHASDYVIVIDTKAYGDDVSSASGIYAVSDVVENIVPAVGFIIPIAVSLTMILRKRPKANK